MACGDMIWAGVIVSLCLLAGILLAGQHFLRYHTVRIYNWDGGRYRFLGRECLHRKNDFYVINMAERIGDLSYTTRYRLAASPEFVRKHRFESLLLRAGTREVWLPVEERMLRDIYYTHADVRLCEAGCRKGAGI